ncbi:AMP-binding protein [Candidatus Poribacteria bacterium]
MKDASPINIFTRFEKEEVEQSITDRFEKQVAKHSHRIAARSAIHEYTYDALNKVANRVARVILAQRGEGEEAIALLLENDVPMIAVIVGILKAGKIYMPLSPSVPHARNAYMLMDSQAELIITNSKNLPLAQELAKDKYQVINFDEIDSRVLDENLGLSISSDTFAYVLYTSGSTGQPKGVIGGHCDVNHEVMRYTNQIHICPEDRLALVTNASVSGSVRGIFGGLLNGAAICSFDLEKEGIANLADWMIQEGITIYRSVATTYRQLVNSLTQDHRFPKLRMIHIGGEPVYKRDVELYKKHFSPDCIFLNGLGITEAGSVRHYFVNKETQINGNIVPVGYAIEDMEVLLLDENGMEVGFDQMGEIAVKSQYISPGYWRRPDLTQARFLPDPTGGDERIYLTGDMGLMKPDRLLMHMGRKDFQVKIRGYRIETGEVENTLLAFDSVREAAVVSREDTSGDQRLVAYLVPATERLPTVSELRRALAETLPDHMIPSAFVMMDKLPFTATGKIDRLALPAPGTSRPELDNSFVAPQTPVEEKLAEIWTQVLGIDQIGIHDIFLELGGNSLLATRIISRVVNTFRIKVSLRYLFQWPTIADMAVVITQRQPRKMGHKDVGHI